MKKICENCKWFALYEEVCTNDSSEHCADFVMVWDSCENWEKKYIEK